jgi:hypothetical protein
LAILFWHAVSALMLVGIDYEELERIKADSGIDLGPAGSVIKWQTDYGMI